MKTQFKQFIKNINTRSLVPMAVFVSVVAFGLWPLKSLSDTASLPCTMLAKSFCMFVLGCYVSEILKGKISRKGFKFICILAVIFCLHIFIVDGIAFFLIQIALVQCNHHGDAQFQQLCSKE